MFKHIFEADSIIHNSFQTLDAFMLNFVPFAVTVNRKEKISIYLLYLR